MGTGQKEANRMRTGKGARVHTIYGQSGEVIAVWGIMRTVLLNNGRYRDFHHTKIWPA